MGMKNATMMAEHSEEASEREQFPEGDGRRRRWRAAAVAVSWPVWLSACRLDRSTAAREAGSRSSPPTAAVPRA